MQRHLGGSIIHEIKHYFQGPDRDTDMRNIQPYNQWF